jgi:alpha-galactosidase/6-phospho-beta-glucosidase family protein
VPGNGRKAGRAGHAGVVKAALSGDRKLALHAFLLEPTLQANLDLDQTQTLLDERLEANSRWLPLFEGARV